MANPMYGSNKSDRKLDEASQRTIPNLVGTDLASDTASITLALDTVYREVVTAHGKPLVLPAISASDIGRKILIISNAVFAGSGSITITPASNDYFSQASTTTGLGVTAPGVAAAGNDLLTLTGADTNCGLQKGSTIMLEVVDEKVWCCTINSVHIGNGSNFAVYTTP
tara:strand:- start:1510 stop:2013 length:504 start_codon:yes stop_codon:yes gene_type:complete